MYITNRDQNNYSREKDKHNETVQEPKMYCQKETTNSSQMQKNREGLNEEKNNEGYHGSVD